MGSVRQQLIVALLAATTVSGESVLTLYNQRFAVVRESLPLELKQGANQIR